MTRETNSLGNYFTEGGGFDADFIALNQVGHTIISSELYQLSDGSIPIELETSIAEEDKSIKWFEIYAWK